MKTFLPLLLILVIFSSATCKKKPATSTQTATEQVNILHTTWYLESMTLAGKSEHLFPATLNIGEQKITGKGGCNNFFGTYKLEGDRIVISKIGATRMYCKEASKFETKYLRALEKVTNYTQKQNRLHLSWAGGELIFSSKPLETVEEAPKVNIQGTKWHLTSIARQGVVSKIRNQKADISLKIDKNKISGNGGCNSYFGQLRLEGNRFIVSDIGATEMYCEETSKQEMAYLKMLEEVTSFRLKNNQLTLIFPKGELLFTQAKR